MSDGESLLTLVRKALEGLKRTPEGRTLHALIARGLARFEATPMAPAFVAFTDRLLERYLASPDSDPATRVRARVIQQRLRPYLDLSPEELARMAPAAAAAPPPAPEPPAVPPPAAGGGSESLPAQLAREMTRSLSAGGDLDELLHKSLAALGLGGRGTDLDTLKRDLVHGIEALLSEHRQLEQQLDRAHSELRHIDADRRALEQTLHRVRERSLVDELTGLPNRQAFLRQLDAEIGRARRYGFSLALALIDIDNLAAVNQRHGRAAGDAVLHAYAREIMGLFRGYDTVARYGEDEFAVLLPNTQKDGATRALDKARRRAAGTVLTIDGASVPLPSFSSVLTLYAHGEPPAALLQRADAALVHARQSGRAQAVVALPPAG